MNLETYSQKELGFDFIKGTKYCAQIPFCVNTTLNGNISFSALDIEEKNGSRSTLLENLHVHCKCRKCSLSTLVQKMSLSTL